MKKLIMIFTLFMLISAAWGYTPDNDRKISSDSNINYGQASINPDKKLTAGLYTGTAKQIHSQHTKIFRGVFDLGVDTISLIPEDRDLKFRSFLSNNANRFNIDPADLRLFSSHIARKSEDLSVLKYKQEYKGFDVYSSRVVAAIRNNKVVILKYNYYPGLEISTKPTLSYVEILNIVEEGLDIPIKGKSLNIQDFQKKKSTDDKNKSTHPEDISLLIYPEDTGSGFRYHLAYKVELGLFNSPPEKWTYIVDANSGDILERYNKVVFSTMSGKINGSIYPESPKQSPVKKNFRNATLYDSQSYTSNVFWSGSGNDLQNYIVTKNPINLSGVSSATLEFKSKFSIEKGYDFGYVMFSFNGQDFYIMPEFEVYSGIKSSWSTRRITLSDLIGNKIWLAFFYETDKDIVYDGWYIDDIKVNTSSGIIFSDSADNFTNWDNNEFSVVQQELEEHTALGNTGPDGSYSLSGLPGNFTLYAELEGPFVNVYNVTGMDVNKTSIIDTPATYNIDWGFNDTSYKREQSNVFYHVNIVHDYFTRESPFDIYEMNYQTLADVQYFGTCNAFADGMNIHFYGVGGGCEATSLFSDVIYHEYTHNVVDHIYTTPLPYREESGALNEGWADYFAAVINENPCMAEGWRGDCLKDLNNTYKYPEDVVGEVHLDSRIVSGAAWDLRQMVGADVTDTLVINALKLEPFNFTEYLEDVIFADDNNSNLEDGTPHLFEICTAFFKNHGIHSYYCDSYYPVPKTLNILKDPGFESGSAAWIEYSRGGYDIFYNRTDRSHYGSVFAWLGGYNNAKDFIYQDITIPSNASQAYVRFWYWINTVEMTTTNPDRVSVEIRKPDDDTLLRFLVNLSSLDKSYGYVISEKYDVSEYRGQTIRLKFNATTNLNALTNFRIDDTELSVTQRVPGEGIAVKIINPTTSSSFLQGELIMLLGNASGGTPPYNYSWISSIDGFIGNTTGEFDPFFGNLSKILTFSLNPGNHVITLSVKDASGMTSSTAINSVVNPVSTTSISGQSASGPMTWTVSNFPAFWQENGKTSETLTVDLNNNSRQILSGGLHYNITRQIVQYMVNEFNSSLLVEKGLDSNGIKLLQGGYYAKIGWFGRPYVALNGQSNKLTKLIIEQNRTVDSQKSLDEGQTWDMGDGWTLTVKSIDIASSQRGVLFVLGKDGVEKDEKVVHAGEVYTYVENNIGGESNVPVFVTYVDSVFIGLISKMVILKYTWLVSENFIEIRSGDIIGNIERITASTDKVSLSNKDMITLVAGSSQNIADGLRIRVNDSSELIFYPEMTVIRAPVVVSPIIRISPSAATLDVNGTQVFTATALDQNNAQVTGVNISWTVSNSTVGNVTPLFTQTGPNGNTSATFTALTVGNTTVNATNGSVSASADVTVTTLLPAAGSISGMKFNDLNNNSIKDTGEAGLTGWTIVLTMLGGSTATRTTYANGSYTFSDLTPGNYTVVEILKPDWKQTLPANGTYNVTITGGENLTGIDFGNNLSVTPPTNVTVAIRTIEKESLRLGESTNITVDISSNISQALSLHEIIPVGWNLTRISDGADGFKSNTNEWIWFNVSPGINRTVIYRLTASDNASIGTYHINGTISSSGVIAVVQGDNTITLDIMAFYRRLGSDTHSVETTDVLTAAEDWRNNTIHAGFERAITTQELLALINEWMRS
jgi:S-layer protein (TIGR01567 family)